MPSCPEENASHLAILPLKLTLAVSAVSQKVSENLA
jgi:hypothetical protein